MLFREIAFNSGRQLLVGHRFHSLVNVPFLKEPLDPDNDEHWQHNEAKHVVGKSFFKLQVDEVHDSTSKAACVAFKIEKFRDTERLPVIKKISRQQK